MANVSDAKTQLLDDFNKIASDTESLLRAVASVPGEKASALRATLEEHLSSARKRVRDITGIATERTTEAARYADEYVHENPWPLIGLAAAVGFVLGLSVRRD